MDASEINHALNMQFNRYDYRLNNSFVFAWESDFLCMSSSGYWVECEVKVTRGDFFRDFDKPKHRLFEAVQRATTHFVDYLGKTVGDEICRYRVGEMHVPSAYGYRKGRNWGDWVNDNNGAYLSHKWVTIQAPASWIRVRPIEKVMCPHQFYFTVPADLIKPGDVPEYAGLIYVKDGECTIIRKAPYLHKYKKMDLTKVLLQKYYNLWRFKSGGDMEKYYECIKVKLL
jgi:hypothetical protein